MNDLGYDLNLIKSKMQSDISIGSISLLNHKDLFRAYLNLTDAMRV